MITKCLLFHCKNTNKNKTQTNNNNDKPKVELGTRMQCIEEAKLTSPWPRNPPASIPVPCLCYLAVEECQPHPKVIDLLPIRHGMDPMLSTFSSV